MRQCHNIDLKKTADVDVSLHPLLLFYFLTVVFKLSGSMDLEISQLLL